MARPAAEAAISEIEHTHGACERKMYNSSIPKKRVSVKIYLYA